MADAIDPSDRALIDQHIASNGVTKIARGASSYDPLATGDVKAGLRAFYTNRARGRRLRKAEREEAS